MLTIILVAFFALSVTTTTAQEVVQHQASSQPADAQFEIVQSALAARWTFRLNRFSGDVAIMVVTKTGGLAWQQMTRIGLSRLQEADYVLSERPHFQIFTSGIGARHTFLIETDIGTTWVLVQRTERNSDGTTAEVYSWELMPYP